MAKVSCIYYPPEIVPYVDMDEEIYLVDTFEECKAYILNQLQKDIDKYTKLTYKEWKKQNPH